MDAFNSNLLIIEPLVKEILKTDYKCIATSLDDWEKIKIEFNNHKKQYNVIDEENLFDEIFNNKDKLVEKDDIEKMFGNIIEYN